jgi:hypothetical protein
VQNS